MYKRQVVAYTAGFYGSLFAGPAVLRATSNPEPTEQQNILALLISSGVYVVGSIALGALWMMRSGNSPKVENELNRPRVG